MAPEVFFTVCFRTSSPPRDIQSLYTFRPAILHDHCRYKVEFAEYPGVIASPGDAVRGVVVTGLSPEDVHLLDWFEGAEYAKKQVKVRVLLSSAPSSEPGGGYVNVEGQEVDASVYIFRNPGGLEDKEWDYAHFRAEKMQKWTRAGYIFDEVLDEEGEGQNGEGVGVDRASGEMMPSENSDVAAAPIPSDTGDLKEELKAAA